MFIGGDLPYFYGATSVLIAYIDHTPLPHAGSSNCLNWLGGGTEREVEWEDCQGGGGRGGGGRVGGGNVKGQLSHRHVGTMVVSQRMWKAPVVQSGRALPMGRCASPP